MIQLQIRHIDSESQKQLGVYPIYSNIEDVNLDDFQKTYVYGLLKNIKRTPYEFSSWESRQSALLHICMFLNTAYEGDFVFVDNRSDKENLPFDLTSDFANAYLRVKAQYDSIEYASSEYDKNDILSYEQEILDKYDPKLASGFKSRAVVNEQRLPILKLIWKKISDFYFNLYKSGVLRLDYRLVYLDFIPCCIPNLSIYTPLNLAFQSKNTNLLNYVLNNGDYQFTILEEIIPIGEVSYQQSSYYYKHDFSELSKFILSCSTVSLRFYKRFRAIHFCEYEKMMEFYPNPCTKPGNLLPEGNPILRGSGNELLKAEYKAAVLCNDISTLNYLIHRFKSQLVDILKFRKNIYTISDNTEDTPSCILQSTKDFLSCLSSSIDSKLRSIRESSNNGIWGYNAVTGAPIYESQLSDIDSQRW